MSYISTIKYLIRRIFFYQVSLKHVFTDVFANFLHYYRIYNQRKLISKKKYIPSIKTHFSTNLEEINYRTLIPQRKIEFTESEKAFFNENIICSKLIKKNKDKGYIQREVFLCKFQNITYFAPTGTLAIKDKPMIETACTLTRLKTIAKTVDSLLLKHRKMKGVYTSIMHVYNHVYYHFLIENIPRFYGISKIEDPKINLIIPKDTPGWQLEILRIFLDKRFDLMPIEINEVWELEKFYFSSFWHVDCSAYIPRELVDFMRKKIFNHYGINPNIERKRKIILSREKIKRRRILNRKDFLDLLERYNFENVNPQDLSFKEQVELANSADIIIGMVGSAFSNIVFGTNLKVIVIFPPSLIISHYLLFCKSLNFTYKYIIGYNENKKFDCEVNLKELEEILKELSI